MGQTPYTIIASPAMKGSAQSVVATLVARGIPVRTAHLEQSYFKNGEAHVQVLDSVEGQHVFYFHAFTDRLNDEFMHLLITCDALARGGVESITLVTPHLPYLRQDRRSKPGTPISARLLANLIETNQSIKNIITFDMHTDQAEGFFKIPIANLSSQKIFVEQAKTVFGNDLTNVVAVAPDFGSAFRTRQFANELGKLPVTICEKRRVDGNIAKLLAMSGAQISGQSVVMYDDMIDTGSTIINTAIALREAPYNSDKILVFATHGIMSDNAETRFAEANIQVVVTNSIPRSPEYMQMHQSWLTVLPIDSLIADTIGASIKQ